MSLKRSGVWWLVLTMAATLTLDGCGAPGDEGSQETSALAADVELEDGWVERVTGDLDYVRQGRPSLQAKIERLEAADASSERRLVLREILARVRLDGRTIGVAAAAIVAKLSNPRVSAGIAVRARVPQAAVEEQRAALAQLIDEALPAFSDNVTDYAMKLEAGEARLADFRLVVAQLDGIVERVGASLAVIQGWLGEGPGNPTQPGGSAGPIVFGRELNLLVPDNSQVGVATDLFAPAEGRIEDVSVELGFQGTHLNELIVELVHPDGTSVTLINRSLAAGQNRVVIGSGGIANGDLARLVGRQAFGTWRVVAKDVVSGDQSALTLARVTVQSQNVRPVDLLTRSYETQTSLVIPDNSQAGAGVALFVPAVGRLQNVEIGVQLEGTHLNELTLTLVHPDGTRIPLAARTLAASETSATFGVNGRSVPELAQLTGKPSRGNWQLHVWDGVNGDVSKVVGLRLAVTTRDSRPDVGLPAAVEVSQAFDLTVPDNNAAGVGVSLFAPADGTIEDVRVELGLAGTHLNELDLELVHPDGTVVPLATRTLPAQAAGAIVFGGSGGLPIAGLAQLVGKPIRGSWSLRLYDRVNADVSQLTGVKLVLQPQVN